MNDDHTKIELMAQDMQYLKEGQKVLHEEIREVKELIKEHIKDENGRFDEAMKGKANRWVESAIYWTAAGVIAAAMGLVWAVVTKKILF